MKNMESKGSSNPIESVENLVLGGGEAGKYIAWDLAEKGQEVIVVERELIGGSCPNIACLPSKNIIRSAEVAYDVSRAQEYGVHLRDIRVDMKDIRQRKRRMVEGMVEIHRKKFAIPNLEFVLGTGRLSRARTIEVQLSDGGIRRFKAERLFLNLGTSAAVPDIPGLRESSPLTNVEILELGELPAHLIIIGGGYVGVEFAQAFRRFGSEVTILQFGTQLLDREDEDVAEALRTLLEGEGITVLTEAKTRAVEGKSGRSVRLRVETPDGDRVIKGTHILVAAGRSPNTRDIGLEKAGIELDERGFIKVDAYLKTSAESVWAAGECAGSPMFTHAALDDFRVIRDNLEGKNHSTRDRIIPYCAFTNPELARIGLDEKMAREKGIDVRIARLDMSKVLRARAVVDTRGFMKMIIDGKTDQILGFTMLGRSAGEVLATVQIAMLGELPYTVLRDAIFTHPTMAEGLNVLLADV